MKILIIGNKGFIGSHSQKYFERNGHEVFGCDVVTDYVSKRYFQIDAANSDYRDVFATVEYDVCINCSGAASVPASLQDPLRDYMLNTANVFKILESIRRIQPHCKFINLSSAAVYGNPQYLPIDEAHPLQPISPYGFHKLAAEKICCEFFQYFGVLTCSLRVFSAYGPGLQKQLFWDVYQKSLGQENLSFFGTGEETRDFIFIEDLVRAIDLTINNSAFHGDIVNIANGQEVEIAYSIDLFLKKLNWTGKYSFSGDVRKGDPLNWRADIGKLKSFGYQPLVSFEDGIELYTNWVQN